MPNPRFVADRPLGAVLQQVGLVSKEQVEAALEEQRHTHRRIGEILAARGWIQQASADFFVEQWPQMKRQASQYRIGQFLQRAGLLDEDRVASILVEQQRRSLKFGTLAVRNGWVRHQTIGFFLRYIEQNRTEQNRTDHWQQTPVRGVNPERETSGRKPARGTTNPFALLLLYQQVLKEGSIRTDGSPEQTELLRVGLVQLQQNRLKPIGKPPPPVLEEFLANPEEQLRPYDGIRLRLLNLESHSARPSIVLAEIFSWTEHQPELTQKLCQVIRETDIYILAGEEAVQIANLVQNHFIQNWEFSTAAEPLRQLRDCILNNQRCRPHQLLQLYRHLLNRREAKVVGSLEEQELLNLGLIAKNGSTLCVANKIYRFVFNLQWIAQVLDLGVETSEPKFAQNSASEPPAKPGLGLSHEAQDDWGDQGERTVSPASQTPAKRHRTVLLGLFVTAIGISAVGLLRQRSIQTSPVALPSLMPPKTSVSSAPPQRQTRGAETQRAAKQRTEQPSQRSETSLTTKRDSLPTRAFSTQASSVAPIRSSSKATSLPATKNKDRSSIASGDNANPAEQPALVYVDATHSVPIFVTGSTQAQLLKRLGPPTWNQQGYYPNSRALLYKGLVSKHIDFGYLLDSSTGRLRQTEMAFDQSIELDAIQRVLKQLLKGTLPTSVQEPLREIYQRRRTSYAFSIKDWKGEIHRDRKGWIYLGIWDADFH
jgi:hypothetical protein